MATAYWNNMDSARKTLKGVVRRDRWTGGGTPKVMRYKGMPPNPFGGCAPDRDYYLGNAIDWDASWYEFQNMPWKIGNRDYFQDYLFPGHYFYASQLYVREAMANKPPDNASRKTKLMWMVDVLGRINDGFLATNIDASVLAEITFVRPLLDAKSTMFTPPSASAETHPMWMYARRLWEATPGVLDAYNGEDRDARLAEVRPFAMYNGFESAAPGSITRSLNHLGTTPLDLMRLPVISNSDVLQAMYGPIAYQVPGSQEVNNPYMSREPLMQACPYGVPSWVTMDDTVYWPWIEGRGDRAKSKYLRLGNKLNWSTDLNKEAGNNVQMREAILDAEMWTWPFHRGQYVQEQYRTEPTGQQGGQSKIMRRGKYIPRQHVRLTELLALTDSDDQWTARVVKTKDSAGNDIWVPSIGYVFKHGVNAWADTFMALGDYGAVIGACSSLWGKMATTRTPLGGPVPYHSMQKAWNASIEGDVSIEKALAFVSLSTAKPVLTGMAVALITGGSAMGPPGMVVAAMGTLLSSAFTLSAAARIRAQQRRAFLVNNRVVDQLFRRFSTYKGINGIRMPRQPTEKVRTSGPAIGCSAVEYCYFDPDVSQDDKPNEMFQRVMRVAANVMYLIPTQLKLFKPLIKTPTILPMAPVSQLQTAPFRLQPSPPLQTTLPVFSASRLLPIAPQLKPSPLKMPFVVPTVPTQAVVEPGVIAAGLAITAAAAAWLLLG